VGWFIQGEGVRKGVILKNLGPLAQWFRVLATKPLIKVFLESCAFRFFFVPENVGIGYPVAVWV